MYTTVLYRSLVQETKIIRWHVEGKRALGIYRTVAAIILTAIGVEDISAGINFATTGVAIIGITFTILHGLCALLVGWILFILGLVAPAKEILGKKTTYGSWVRKDKTVMLRI